MMMVIQRREGNVRGDEIDNTERYENIIAIEGKDVSADDSDVCICTTGKEYSIERSTIG